MGGLSEAVRLRPPSEPPSRFGARTGVDVAVLVGAGALWAFALWHTNVDRVNDFGLLWVIHPVFLLVPVALIAGFLIEVVQGARRAAVLVAYLVLLIFVIHGTTPILLTQPQYAWTYKHVGVIEFFLTHPQASNAGDIYQLWPAFFAAAAQLSELSGVSPLHLAPWAAVFFNLVGSFLLFAIARVLSPDRRVAYLTVLLFQCINWIEEDYLSPQGLAFMLSIAVIFVVLRWLWVTPSQDAGRSGWLRRGNAGERASRPSGRAGRVRAYLRNGMTVTTQRSEPVHIVAIIAVIVAMTVLSAAHQLSPYVVALSVLALSIVGVVRPWLALLLVAIPVVYLVPRYNVISGSFGLFDGFNLFRNAGGTADAWRTIPQAFSAATVRVLALTVWILAAIAVYRGRRQFGRLLVPTILAVVPFVLIVVQSYGGEAIYRVFLFSAPWCAFLLGSLAVQGHWSSRWRIAGGTVIVSLMLFATIQGRHGQLAVDRQTANEVAASQYLYTHAQTGSTIILATPNFPSRVTASYGDYNHSVAVGEPDLVKGAKLRFVNLNEQYVPAIEAYASTFEGTGTYLVLSDGMRRYAHYFGYLPDGSLDTLERTLDNAPQWMVFYRNPDVVIYQLTTQ
jgi:hypothetical protein